MSMKAQNRWQAFGVHLVISLLLFVVLASIIYFLWYPGFLFLHDGGLQGMKLIAGVDFVIGPILTLCVYKVGKKGLWWNLVLIGVMQTGCLGFGMWNVWQTRPVAVVYAAGKFMTINHRNYMEIGKVDPAAVTLLKSKWPVWVAVDVPKEDEDSIATVWALTGGSLHYNVDSYVPYEKGLGLLNRHALSSNDIHVSDNEAAHKLESSNKSVKFFPVMASEDEGYLAVDTGSGAVLAYFQ
ncbi:MAG TPA: hypothetical protein PLF22_00270 [Pseudomonadales bacterium]|nr:hypothetical protein [Pseudomonadales bacterium]